MNRNFEKQNETNDAKNNLLKNMQPYFFAFCFENFYNFDFIPMKCSLQGVLEVFFKN